jgi:hypothetical protein
MRVQMKRGSYANSSCENFQSGEVEDYSISISGNAMVQHTDIDQIGNIQEKQTSISVYPNPVHEHLTLEFETTTGNSQITIFDLSGKKIIDLNGTTQEGKNKFEINTSELIPGFYILNIEINDKVDRRKILVE